MIYRLDAAPAEGLDLPLAASAPKNEPRELVIERQSGWRWINLGELWHARELLYSLIWRDVKVRYKQTFLGAAWAVLQPLLMMMIFVAIISRMGQSASGGVPYPFFVYCGLLLWFFFSRSITTASNSVVQSQALITKVYFPRLTIPLAAVGAAAVDYLVGFVLLLLMMVYYGIGVHWSMLWVPVVMLVTALAALGFGTILAALNVTYRDFRVTVPFLVQIWLLATPAIYLDLSVPPPAPPVAPGASSGDVTAQMARKGNRMMTARRSVATGMGRLIDYNPIMGLVDAFRAAILGRPMPWGPFLYSTSLALATFVFGCFYFRRAESRFADVI